MKTFTSILTYAVFLCITISYSPDDLERLYHSVLSKPQIYISLLDGDIQVVNIYKNQIQSIYEARTMAEEEGITHYVHDVYYPHKEYWSNFFDEQGFRKWTKKNWNKLKNANIPGMLIPLEVDFDSLFVRTVSKMKTLTFRQPHGKWYLVYGNKAANIGGFSNGDMFVDFFGVGNDGAADLTFSLPHEINHQIFGKANSSSYSLIHRIIDEGFACYLNYLYWDKIFTPAKNIDFTKQEWKWCVDNERTIFNCAKPLLDSTSADIVNKFARAHSTILEGAPDRIAYFIGFRICEAYVKKKGKDSWRDIYSVAPIDVLKLSDYENSLHN